MVKVNELLLTDVTINEERTILKHLMLHNSNILDTRVYCPSYNYIEYFNLCSFPLTNISKFRVKNPDHKFKPFVLKCIIKVVELCSMSQDKQRAKKLLLSCF